MAAATCSADLATLAFEEWLADHFRSGWARTFECSSMQIRDRVLGKARFILDHAQPAAANRRWLCEAVHAWAPLEVLFPTRDYTADCGVSGDLASYLEEIITREYGHVLAGARSVRRTAELLQADAQRLELDIAIAAAFEEAMLTKGDSAWVTHYMTMSLAIAEYLHRQVLGLSQLLSDDAVMRYTAHVSLRQREARGACALPALQLYAGA